LCNKSYDLNMLNKMTWQCYLSQPLFGIGVRVKPTLPKVGSRSLLGLPKIQSSSSGVKTPRIGVFLIPLERSWSVNVQNGLAWAIWTFAAQVMGKRMAKSQTGLAVWLPTTKSRESTSSWRPQQATRRWKALDESYKFDSKLVLIQVRGEKLWTPKVPGVQIGTVSGLHLGSPGKKSHMDVASTRSCREYYKGEGGGFPRVRAVVCRVSPS
jgi:hypothetical protein